MAKRNWPAWYDADVAAWPMHHAMRENGGPKLSKFVDWMMVNGYAIRRADGTEPTTRNLVCVYLGIDEARLEVEIAERELGKRRVEEFNEAFRREHLEYLEKDFLQRLSDADLTMETFIFDCPISTRTKNVLRNTIDRGWAGWESKCLLDLVGVNLYEAATLRECRIKTFEEIVLLLNHVKIPYRFDVHDEYCGTKDMRQFVKLITALSEVIPRTEIAPELHR